MSSTLCPGTDAGTTVSLFTATPRDVRCRPCTVYINRLKSVVKRLMVQRGGPPGHPPGRVVPGGGRPADPGAGGAGVSGQAAGVPPPGRGNLITLRPV
ncbi:hypothetical protein Sru01_48770 [Sphaerisporangium rufum]|uniref:Uncharacterized protein n=1 Tax=Sphaerisporangium rufum TaxID=1381558 RepID=A0A919R9P4_9ACTN|nr:hypothetical protein Sru01_48770 [Sphaerisporangium rufum]